MNDKKNNAEMLEDVKEVINEAIEEMNKENPNLIYIEARLRDAVYMLDEVA